MRANAGRNMKYVFVYLYIKLITFDGTATDLIVKQCFH
jgi:hypothetical protein